MNVITQSPAAHDYAHDLRFQAMFEGAAIGIGICQLDGRVSEANPALGRMLGYSPQELTGAQAGELYPGIGCRFCSGNGLPGKGLPDEFLPDQRLLGELLRGERGWFEIEKRYRRKDGSELWGHLTVSLGRDERRQPAFLITMLADATERRQVEEHLREAEKMEVIGRLAGGIAHDFNNLLTGILLYCDLLNAELETGGLRNARSASSGLANPGLANQCSECLENLELARRELCQHVEDVRMAGEQGAALTQQLLAIARKQAAEPRPISINEIVASMQNLLRRLIGEQIELVTALDSGAGLVLADPAQLRQIVLNLVLNARDAMPQGGTIRLITRAAEFPRESTGDFASNFATDSGPGSARRAVSLAVKDNGCGMDAETRTRLFEPFFTTKRPGEGTGLGLATVQRIVSEAGGMIEVESEPGRGTLIEVFLPVIVSAPRTSLFEDALEESAKEASSTGASSQRASLPAPSP
jgi:two-component system cell cycle sensor histidine kinase/response regulator CckA